MSPVKHTMATVGIGLSLLVSAFTAPLFVQAASEDAPFKDVTSSDALYDAANYLKDRGVVEGYADGELKPENNINRAEFVKIILEGREDIEVYYDAQYAFPDIPSGEWYAPYVSTAKRLGIVEGYPDGNFNPAQTINYPEAIKVILETYDVALDQGTAPDFLAPYRDQWFAKYLTTAYNRNIFTPGTGFVPGAFIDRGESFESLYRTIEIRERGLTRFAPMPRPGATGVYLGGEMGIVDSAVMTPVKLPVRYNGITQDLDITLYKTSTPADTYIKFLQQSGKEANEWGMATIPTMVLATMNKESTFKAKITPLNQEFPFGYYYFEEQGEIELPISTPGFYAIKVEYKGKEVASSFVNVSDLAVTSRLGETQELFWALNRKTFEPLQNTNLTMYNFGESALMYSDASKYTTTTAKTGTDGVALVRDNEAQLVFAENAGHTAVIFQDSYEYYFGYQEDQPTGYAYTDRPLYRPGDKVNFRIMMREGEAMQYKVPTDRNVELQIRDNNNKVVHEANLALSKYGTATGEFTLSDTATTGWMSMVLRQGDQDWYWGNFQVEAYKKDEYFVTVDPDKDYYIMGQDAKLTMKAQYYFGEPVKNQKLTYTVYRDMYYIMPYMSRSAVGGVAPDGVDMDMIMPPRYPYNNDPVLKGTGTFDSTGSFVLNFTPGEDDEEDDYYKDPIWGTRRYRVEVSTMDSSNIEVTGSANFDVHEAEYSIMTTDQNRFPEINKEHTVSIDLMNPMGADYKKATTLNVALKRTVYERVRDGEWYDWWKRTMVPNYTWKSYEEDLGTSTVSTNASGKGSYKFTPELPGTYTLTITGSDSLGNTATMTHSVQVRGDKDGYGAGNWGYEYINMTPDKLTYNGGETARIALDTGVENSKVLITYAKSDILEYKIVDVKGYSTEITRALKESDAPGLMVYAETLGDRGFINGSASLVVIPTSKQLQVSVKPSKTQAMPGEEVDYVITVKDKNGNPVVGEFSFALIDKAVLDMKAPDWNNLFQRFYPEGSYYYLPRFDSIRQYAQYYYRGGMAVDAAADGGVREEAAEDTDMDTANPTAPTANGGDKAEELAAVPRTDFLDTAFFRGQVVTNAQGQATLKVALPDNVTTWVGVAIGLTEDTKLGVGQAEMIAKKDVIVSPFLPRFVTIKDKVTVRAMVRNYTDKNGTFAVTMTADGARLLSNKTATVGVAAGGSAEVSWEVEILAPGTTGYKEELTLQMTAIEQTTKAQDSVVQKLPVQLLGQERVQSQAGEGSTTVTLSPETGDYSNMRAVEINITPTLADNIIHSIEYLVGYPYGCVEQTMSRFLPTLVAYNARNQLRFNNADLFKDIDGMVDQGLDRLYMYQHADGGWGWWENDASMLKNSAYVMYGLTMAKKGGFDVRQDVYNNGLGFLEKNIKALANGTYQDPTKDWYGGEFSPKRYIPYYFYVLALNGKNMEAELNSITIADQTAGDIAYIALGYHALGQTAKAQALIDDMESKLTTSGNSVYVNESVMDYERMYSRTLATSLVLEAFATIDSDNQHIEGMLRWLDSIRDGYSYGETHTTAHAVLALVAYMKSQGTTSGTTSYTVKLGSETLASGSLDGMKTITVDPRKLSATNNKLTITKTGGGKLYYTVIGREFVNKDSLAAVSNGFSVKRSYVNKQGNAISNTARAGDIVRVNLEVNASEDSYYVMLRDMLPAGLEAVNPRLAKDAGFNIDMYQGEWVDHIDYYDSEVAMFRTRLEKGAHTFTYYARVVTPGTYKINPAYMEMMYAPEKNGASMSGTLTVTK